VPAPVTAHANWNRIALVSDLHLGAHTPRTSQAFLDWLGGPARQAQALFILGDLFEAWVGDDLLSAQALTIAPDAARCAQRIAAALRHYTQSGGTLFVQHGNRDFLLGPAFAHATGAVLLPDPALLQFNGARILLTHGDQLCLGDSAYLIFRAQVRNPDWQRHTLAQPLAVRLQQAQALRAASAAAQERSSLWADADPQEACRWMHAASSRWMIHGHTHRPRDHWAGGLLRQVLADWDCDTPAPPRAQALWLQADGKALCVHRATVTG
jgi:UDP-2,3-diacylglucosamine hydrolase